MPTGPMRKVVTTVTGVEGSPYYIVGYFDANEGTTAQVGEAWHLFITGSTSGSAAGFPTGSTIRTDSEIAVIDPTDGAVLEVQNGVTISQIGANTGARTPPATQMLMRWRTGNYVNRREVRGRTNLPCVMEEASTEDGKPEPSVITGLESRADALIDNADVSHVVWSKKNGVWWATSSASLWDQFSVLRSRRD